MRKILSLMLLVFVISSINSFGQKNEEISIDVKTIRIKTDRAQRNNGQGQFFLEGEDENGIKFPRQSFEGSFFIAPALNCEPCQKGTIFPEFTTQNWHWRTGGTSIEPTEFTRLLGEITIPQISIPIQSPRFRPLVIFVPLNFDNELRVVDQSDVNNIKTYIDPQVNLTGYMRLEFKQELSNPTQYLWINADINLFTVENNLIKKQRNSVNDLLKLK